MNKPVEVYTTEPYAAYGIESVSVTRQFTTNTYSGSTYDVDDQSIITSTWGGKTTSNTYTEFQFSFWDIYKFSNNYPIQDFIGSHSISSLHFLTRSYDNWTGNVYYDISETSCWYTLKITKDTYTKMLITYSSRWVSNGFYIENDIKNGGTIVSNHIDSYATDRYYVVSVYDTGQYNAMFNTYVSSTTLSTTNITEYPYFRLDSKGTVTEYNFPD